MSTLETFWCGKNVSDDEVLAYLVQHKAYSVVHVLELERQRQTDALQLVATWYEWAVEQREYERLSDRPDAKRRLDELRVVLSGKTEEKVTVA